MSAMDHYLVLAPADHPVILGPGSRKIIADCGHEVWIAATGIRLLADSPQVKSCCLRCTPDTPPAEVYAPPGAREEMNERIGVAETDQLFAAMADYNARKRR